MRWYRMAAEQGHTSDQFNLALLQYYGDAINGYEEAYFWYTIAGLLDNDSNIEKLANDISGRAEEMLDQQTITRVKARVQKWLYDTEQQYIGMPESGTVVLCRVHFQAFLILSRLFLTGFCSYHERTLSVSQQGRGSYEMGKSHKK